MPEQVLTGFFFALQALQLAGINNSSKTKAAPSKHDKQSHSYTAASLKGNSLFGPKLAVRMRW